MPAIKSVLINIDVEDLEKAAEFYTAAFHLRRGRRLGPQVLELTGAGLHFYLLQKERGSSASSMTPDRRRYDRHWTPVHLDFVVDSIDESLAQFLSAGGKIESPTRDEKWGRIAQGSDPFGNGICLIQFLGRGYDEA